MQTEKKQKLNRAVLISTILHGLLFGILILGSLWYKYMPAAGGGEGEGDVMGAVMVDTGSAAQEWGRIQQQQKGDIDKAKREELEQLAQQRQQEQEKLQEQQRQKQEQEQREKQEQQEQQRLEQQRQQQAQAEQAKQQEEIARQQRIAKDAEAKRIAEKG